MPKKTIKKNSSKISVKSKISNNSKMNKLDNSAHLDEDEDSLGENFIWKCKCGHIEHSTIPPEDCPKCLRISQFKKVNESKISDLYDEEVLSTRESTDDIDGLEGGYEDDD